MRRIFLLRHAKASWPGPGMRDFDRPLHESGLVDAEKLGQEMAKRNLVPSKVICSPARRAKETWSKVSAAFHDVEVEFDADLYHGDATVYLDRILTESASPLMLIGHNPMLEDVAHAMCAHGRDNGGPVINTGYPAGGLSVFDLPLDKGISGAQLVEFLPPGQG